MVRSFSVLLMLLVFLLQGISLNAGAVENTYRVVTLAPHITELFFEVGAGHFVVGTVEYANYPLAAKKIERVGAYNSVSVERILALKPDFVVAIPNSAMSSQIEKLQKLGVDVRFSDPATVNDVAEQLLRIGTWVGKEKDAKARAQRFLNDWQDLKNRYQGKTLTQQKVFFQAWLKPLMTLNQDNLIHQIIEVCGGHNVYGHLPMPVPHISVESVISAQPDIILYNGPEPSDETQKYWALWPSIPAVKQNRIYWVHDDDLARPVPEILKGAQTVCAYLHAEEG